MAWLIFSFLTALCESFTDVFSKFSLKDTDEYVVAWSMRLFAVPFLIPVLFFIEIPPIGLHFWTALFAGGLLNIITTVMYMKAIKHSDLSITVPMVTFTPLFLLITSPVMVGEFPDACGMAGVIIIVLGSYILNIRYKQKGYLAPFKALIKEKGPRLMLGVAFIWSITSNFDKIGIQNSSPMFWVIAINFFLQSLWFLLFCIKQIHRQKKSKHTGKYSSP